MVVLILTLSSSKFCIASKFGHVPKNGTCAIAAFAMITITNIRNIFVSEKEKHICSIFLNICT